MNLIKMLDDLLMSREHRSSDSWHPSGATQCNRRLYYSKKGVPESNPMPIANKWQCEMGNAIHDMIAKMLGELMPVRSEKSFKFQHQG